MARRSLIDNQFVGLGIGIAPSGSAMLTLPAGATAASGILWGTDTTLYRLAADALVTDDLLVVPAAQNDLTKKLGLMVGNGGWTSFFQSGVNNAGDAFIGHNAYVLYNASNIYETHWQATHGSFGSRGMGFSFSTGIQFFADNAAATAGSTFTQTERMRMTNDGTLLIGTTTDISGFIGLPAGTTQATGGIVWGTDTNLYRSGADSLASDDQFTIKPGVAGQVRIGNGTNGEIAFGSAADAILYRSAAATLTTNSALIGPAFRLNATSGSFDGRAQATGAGTAQFLLGVVGDTNALGRFYTAADGSQFWSDGTNPVDTNLYRSAANTLKTDDAFQAASYAVGTTALASTHLSDTALLARLAAPTFTGAVVATGTLRVGGTAPVSNALISAVVGSNSLEWGHTNAVGYRSTLGANLSNGKPFLAFNAEGGTNNDTFRTRGIAGSIIQSDLTGGFVFGNAPTATADNQNIVQTLGLSAAGVLTLAEGGNLVLGSTTGTKIGTATTQKLAFFNATPIVQQAQSLGIKATLQAFGFMAAGNSPTPLDLDGGLLTTGTLAVTSTSTFTGVAAFTAAPTGPTGTIDVGGTGLATQAYVLNQAAAASPLMNGAVAVGTSTRYARADHVHASDTTRQPIDATLTALAAYNTNGILTQTAADTFVGRTLTGDAEIVVTNGSGVAGNPTLSIAAAIARLASPVFSGAPNLPTGTIGFTQIAGNSSTALATTAFVTTADNLKANVPTAIATQSVLDVGVSGQVRAGRPLVLADFTTLLGLTAPIGLFNLGSTANLGTGGVLTNKGTVTFTTGISGTASEAAQFDGTTGKALYIADAAGGPFCIRTGSWGCWFRTGKRSTSQGLVTKIGIGTIKAWELYIGPANLVGVDVSFTGTSWDCSITGTTNVGDDRWHLAIATFDGSQACLYVDGVLESSMMNSGFMASVTGPFNIGGTNADGTTLATVPHYGAIDEAFVTADVLSEEQIRLLYCAKIPHGATTLPTSAKVAVRRKKKGGPLVSGDFPSQPVRLYNFTAGVLTDAGSGATSLTNNNAAVSVSGADGAQGGGFNFIAASSQSLSSTDSGLPSSTNPRSYGCWFKTNNGAASTAHLVCWGAVAGTSDSRLTVAFGDLVSSNGSNDIFGPWVADGQWHFAVAVEDNTAQGTARANLEVSDGVRRKLYLDGKLVGSSIISLNSISVPTANHFRIGASVVPDNYFDGLIDGVFVHNIALTAPQVAKLYAVGSQALPPSPKNAGEHIEAIDSVSLYTIFDSLPSQTTTDLEVS